MKIKEQYSLYDASRRSGQTPDLIVRYISFEWIVPCERSEDPQNQTLDKEDLARICMIKQLQEEFGVNDESIPIILGLLDQLNRTHLEVRRWLASHR